MPVLTPKVTMISRLPSAHPEGEDRARETGPGAAQSASAVVRALPVAPPQAAPERRAA
jgi:hypothetical protein